MRMRWFGEPWPSATERAAVCEDEEYRADTPLGMTCIGCNDLIVRNERGVIMGASENMPDAWFAPALDQFVCAEHIDCLIRTTVGPEYANVVTRVPEPEPEPDPARLAAIAACPEPFWHKTHRYCPCCPWTEDDEPKPGLAGYENGPSGIPGDT